MIFLDTSFLIALELESDEHHKEAVELRKSVAAGKYGNACTSDYVFDETVTFTLAKTKNLQKTIKIGNTIRESAQLLKITESTFEIAWNIFKAQREAELSFTDCTNIAIMRQNSIREIATFDNGFAKLKGINVVNSE